MGGVEAPGLKPSGAAPQPLENTALKAGAPAVHEPFPRLGHGVQWGLERTRSLLATLGRPQLAYPSIHIGGTNGKGSVAAICARVLREAGLRTGLYTSPHLCDFRERIQVDGRPIERETMTRVAADLHVAVDRIGPTFFEATTALAFGVFADREVDIAVVEVGLGGRLDATNVIVPLVTCITNVSLDHADYLGPTVEDIAREKAGIMKPGIPIHTSETDGRVLRILRDRATRAETPFFVLDPLRDLRDLELSTSRTSFRMSSDAWGDLELSVPLAGGHQATNAALAARALESLPEKLRPTRRAVVRGLAEVSWPGRVQLVSQSGVTWVFDVAHNVAGMETLATTLRSLGLPRPIVVLAGILGDKDWGGMLPGLLAVVDATVLTQPPSAPGERRWNPGQVAAALAPRFTLEVEADFGSALARVAERAEGGTAVVTGSCHTVGSALDELCIQPFPTSFRV